MQKTVPVMHKAIVLSDELKSAYCLTSGKDEFLDRENQLKLDPDGFSKDYRFNMRLKNSGSIFETYLWSLNL